MCLLCWEQYLEFAETCAFTQKLFVACGKGPHESGANTYPPVWLSREERWMGARQALVGPAGAEQSPPCCFAEMSTFLGVPLVKAINT